MAHKHLHKHSGITKNKSGSSDATNAIYRAAEFNKETSERSAVDSESSSPPTGGPTFQKMIGDINKYIETSKGFIKNNALETAALAATAGLAALAVRWSKTASSKPAAAKARRPKKPAVGKTKKEVAVKPKKAKTKAKPKT